MNSITEHAALGRTQYPDRTYMHSTSYLQATWLFRVIGYRRECSGKEEPVGNYKLRTLTRITERRRCASCL